MIVESLGIVSAILTILYFYSRSKEQAQEFRLFGGGQEEYINWKTISEVLFVLMIISLVSIFVASFSM